LNNLKILTNNSGEFSFTAKPGAYILTVTYVGYKKAEQPIRIEGVIEFCFCRETICPLQIF
jgi:hypothetical protein